jgi:hypothetical protein
MSDLHFITQIIEGERETRAHEQRVADVVTVRRRGSQ